MRTLCDHPAWANGRRIVRTANGFSLASTGTGVITLSAAGPVIDVYDPADLTDAAPAHLRNGLEALGPVTRLRTPDLWEAVATAIIRQVIRADQARLMCQRFSEAFGSAPAGDRLFLLPSAETTLTLSDTNFTDLGMAFKRRGLRAAAEAVLKSADTWTNLAPAQLVEELQAVPRIGPWTAGAAVADFTGDFSLYPHGDMAVRKYARQTFPDLDLPDVETDFATRWRGYAGSPGELSVLTALTLSVGGARAPQPPDESA